ncbi:DNA mismatch repair protein MutL [Limihaloglobus sulfuriphilus]|uniref:DNA mismatch repair protein MutL n=1 Tax=Limihaloglobus sulfuriphilus TaxID=1851148 RepID=A0A1Q2MDW0_9BACT|nr:DNA mismatch repair endonuclease MutL [Limihaloglobus sulfuriphilus]AQQ70893.1 DNA mismatch repair protein MutL [Limihaloglobus sulfuriphilus]
MAKIAVLDKNMINMIAAGEVIERPANIVKELMENSIDAGASRIAVSVEDGGKRLIQVTDDGGGIEPEDIETAFEPHATSKLRTMDELLGISSMGFRGEALASISSVARVKIKSRERDSISAYSMEIDCGDKGAVTPVSGDYGTTLEVRDLFYKLPARRKFLKTVNTEMGHISEQFTRIALANCGIEMKLSHNGRLLYHLLAGDDVVSRISVLLTKDIAQGLVPVLSEEKDLTIAAYLGHPSISRTTNKFQYTFLNGRYIRDRFITHSLKEAYRGLTEPNRFPVAFIFLQMPYDMYDVNVHPTKIEVRFDNPNLVHSQLLGVIREKLMSLDLDVEAGSGESLTASEFAGGLSPEMSGRQQRVKDALADFFKTGSKPATQRNFNFTGDGKSSRLPSSPPKDFSVGDTPNRLSSGSGDFPNQGPRESGLGFSQFYDGPVQVNNTYILLPTGDGFMVIDQHALHERIIFQKLSELITGENSRPLQKQRFLVPETLDVTASQLERVNQNSGLFDKLGIEIEEFGPSTIAIHSFPMILEKVSPAEFVSDLLDMLITRPVAPDDAELLQDILEMAACKAAVKANQRLSRDEMEDLVAQKGLIESSSRCPHGRPTVLKFSIDELEKQFKRRGF